MQAIPDRRRITWAIAAVIVVSLGAVAATPALAARTHDGPRITPNGWIALGSMIAATVIFQSAALILARRRPLMALFVAIAVGWVVIAAVTGMMFVSGTFLLFGLAVVAQQVGRMRPWALVAQTIGLVAGLALERNAVITQFESYRPATGFEMFVLACVLPGAATMISWRVWADDRRLVRLAAQLRASRSRLVEAADAERRSLERDLHDGAQQWIVTAAINVSTARRLVAVDLERVEVILDATMRDLREAAAQLRDVSHGIYPAELSRDGLDAALRNIASRSSLPVTVTVRDVARRGDDVEAAVYFCCAEAVQNATKHAGRDARVSIRVDRAGEGLAVTISDTGTGFDASDSIDGHGLTNMRDRIGAVGGTLTIHTHPGHGTTIHVHIPPDRSVPARPARSTPRFNRSARAITVSST